MTKLGLFGGRDKSQDQAITDMNKNLKAVWNWLKAFDNYHKEMNKLLPGVFKRLQQLEANNHASTGQIAALQQTIEVMKKKDQEFAKMFQGLASVSTEAVKEEGG